MHPTIPTADQLYFGRPPRDRRQCETQEDAFFRSLRLPNGTHKTTCRRRLTDLDQLVQGLLPRHRPLEIMDVAISSGVSTVEWLDSLARAGIPCHLVAGDAVMDACVISLAGWLKALVDRTGRLLQLDIAGHAVRLPPPRRRDRVRYFPLLLLMSRIAQANAPRVRSCCGSGQGVHGPLLALRPLKLLSPSLAATGRFAAVEDDILRDRHFPHRFDVLRAANILNHGYFDRKTLQKMLANLRRRLRPSGLLIVCRSMPEGTNHGSVFRLGEQGRFSLIAKLNDGSEITDLVLGLAPNQVAPSEPEPALLRAAV
ncbi:MAG: hypothetical protein ACREUT_02980 [Steroidobacteraceae bacterium]